MESVGVRKNEFDVCENFEADISFANNRYEVKLPLRSEHDMLDDNFLLCKSRLKIYLTASLGKTHIYLNVTMKLLRIKLKAELLKGHQGHTL